MASLHLQTLAASTGRLLIVGDVHGCAEELQEMLARFQPEPEDQIVAVGDLINRGPDSARVLDLVRKHKIQTVLGNHELRLLHAYHSRNREVLKSKDQPTFDQLTNTDFEWIAGWPHVIRVPKHDALIVHGGFSPHLPWRCQNPSLVTHIQVMDDQGRWHRRTKFPEGTPWGALWKGPERVFFGHTPMPDPQVHPLALGLDTGCVYGFFLTGISLPDEKFYSVRAKKAYIEA